MPIYIRPARKEGHVQAYSPDVAGLSAVAPSLEEALRLLRLRVEQYFEETRASNPPPGTISMEIEV